MSKPSQIEYGYCQCGCGVKTKVSPQSHTVRGYIKGEPRRFLPGHNHGKGPTPPQYIVDETTGCWVWQRALAWNGYAIKRGHRRFYEQKFGPIPEGLHIDHLCRNRRCVNPDHLEPVTPRENLRRGAQAVLTEKDVREIKALLRQGVTQKQIAERYGTTTKNIGNIARGKNWSDVE